MCVGTTASDNVAIGYRSMRDVSTGCYNTAINQALPLISTGCYNTAVGYLAGFSISTGNNNLLLGNDAGRATSPSGNLTTVLGHNAEPSSDNNQ
jgi:trimeric autotransporter adhesin